MATRRRRDKHSRGSDALLGYLIPLVVCGLAVADFARDGQIDKYLLGLLLVFGLGALGYRVDTLIEKYIEAKAAQYGAGGGPAKPTITQGENVSEGDGNA